MCKRKVYYVYNYLEFYLSVAKYIVLETDIFMWRLRRKLSQNKFYWLRELTT